MPNIPIKTQLTPHKLEQKPEQKPDAKQPSQSSQLSQSSQSSQSTLSSQPHQPSQSSQLSKSPQSSQNQLFIQIEKDILNYWKSNKIYEKVKEKNKKGKRFYFLDGPPYTSGRVHLGTAWNKSLKDMVLRYKRMLGLNVWDRAGYDMHGMPTENAVQKELKLKNKDEILTYGMGKFVNRCKEFSINNMKLMNEDFKRLGVWMDFENAYYTIAPEYIESCWWLIKKAHENKRLYRGEKTMHWCAHCGTALAKHELEYKSVTENSIFLKFKIIGTENEYLIVWTTTPWTIPFNLGVMVNPDLEYVKVRAKGKNIAQDKTKDKNGKVKEREAKDGKETEEIWIVAKGLAAPFMMAVCNQKLEIIEEFKGDKLEGVKYKHPFYDIVPVYKELDEKHDKTFSVVLSEEYVDLSAGTGLVHMAPGCGPEDYEIGHRNKIPPFNNLTEHGIFPKEMNQFAGWTAKKDDKKFVDELERQGSLIAETEVTHDYAHCWRCKEPVIFRATEQWFFRTEDLKETMRELNKNIYWIPEFAGTKTFDSWLSNLRDNGITRQRYWGTPLPIWKCDNKNCGHYVVIGSLKELEKYVGKENMPSDLHKPIIDNVTFKCEKCSGNTQTLKSPKTSQTSKAPNGTMVREPDILDVWIDAGVSSWACLYYPNRQDLFKEMFPAEFILEGIDQIRGWFNLLFVASMISMEKPSYKAVYMHGFINDAQGRKMSKSLGNYILPKEVIDEYGSEIFRYYMIGGAKPGVDINYNFEDMKVKFRTIIILWNLQKFIIDLKKSSSLPSGFVLKLDKKTDKKKLSSAEEYILSKLNSTIKKVSELYEKYMLDEIPWKIEELYLELSRTYVQLVRDKASMGTQEEKEMVLAVMFEVLFGTIKLLAPICPMLTEKIYLNLKEEFGVQEELTEESIHLITWPNPDESMLNTNLEANFEIGKNVIQAILSAREKSQMGVRWPLLEAVLVTTDKDTKTGIKEMEEIIKTQTNVKSILIVDKFDKIKVKIKPNYNSIKTKYKNDVPVIVAHLMQQNENSILRKLEKGEYNYASGDKKFVLTKEDIIVEKETPKEFVESEFKNGFSYINMTRTKELEAEGYARDIMRRVQALRKKAGLEKRDFIRLCINIDTELTEMIEPFEKEIQEKCGVKEFYFGEHSGYEKKEFQHKESDKVKGKNIEISLEMV